MISVVALSPLDGDRRVICQTRSLAAARVTAEAESSRLGRLCLILDSDGAPLGSALSGQLLDVMGEPLVTPDRVWS